MNMTDMILGASIGCFVISVIASQIKNYKNGTGG